MQATPAKPAVPTTAPKPALAAPPPQGDERPIAEHPLVKQTMDLLNAKLIGVQPRMKKE